MENEMNMDDALEIGTEIVDILKSLEKKLEFDEEKLVSFMGQCILDYEHDKIEFNVLDAFFNEYKKYTPEERATIRTCIHSYFTALRTKVWHETLHSACEYLSNNPQMWSDKQVREKYWNGLSVSMQDHWRRMRRVLLFYKKARYHDQSNGKDNLTLLQDLKRNEHLIEQFINAKTKSDVEDMFEEYRNDIKKEKRGGVKKEESNPIEKKKEPHDKVKIISSATEMKPPRERENMNSFEKKDEKNQEHVKKVEQDTKHEERESIDSFHEGKKITITRKFALLPDARNSGQGIDTFISEANALQLKKQDARARKKVFSQIKDAFVMYRDVQDQYVKLLTDLAIHGGIDSFRNKSKTAIKNLFIALNRKYIQARPFKTSFRVTNRLQQFAFKSAFKVVRRWVMRNTNLQNIASRVAHLLVHDKKFALKFLRGKRWSYSELTRLGFVALLAEDCFGKEKKMSLYDINNHVLQLRNLFFEKHEFTAQELLVPHERDTLLQERVKARFGQLSNSRALKERKGFFFNLIATSFTKKKKGKTVKVRSRALLSHLQALFFYNLKRISKGIADIILSLDQEMNHLEHALGEEELTEEEKARINESIQEKARLITKNRDALTKLIGDKMNFSDIKEFKKARKPVLDARERDLKAIVSEWKTKELFEFIQKAFQKELDSYSDVPNASVLKRIFKPTFSRISITSPTLDAFKEYLVTKLQYMNREHFKEFFTDIMKFMSEGIREIGDDIFTRVSVPMFKTFSLHVLENQGSNLTFISDFKKDEEGVIPFVLKMIAPAPAPANPRGKPQAIKFNLTINDEKNRIQELVDEGFEMKLPIITFNYRKLILNLPFEKGIHSKPSPEVIRDDSKKMGVDSGLTHPLVLTMLKKLESTNEEDIPHVLQEVERDVEQYLELANHFLGWNDIFNKKFVDGKIVYQDRIWMMDEHGHIMRDGEGKPIRANTRKKKGNLMHVANMKQKMVNLRNELKTLQSQWNTHQASMDETYDVIRTHLSDNMTAILNDVKDVFNETKLTGECLKTLVKTEKMVAIFQDLTKKLKDEGHDHVLNEKEKKKLIKTMHVLWKYPSKKEDILKNFKATYSHKKKYNQLKTQISACWHEVNNIHQQLVHYLVHLTIAIANHHGVSELFVENLKWAFYKKKREAGGFLAFWRTSWLHGAEQEATELQCKMNGIKFTRINPKGSSYTCPHCGHAVRSNRVRKKFECKRCGYRADSDLVSSRIMPVGNVQKVQKRKALIVNLVKHPPRKNKTIPVDSS